MEDLIPVVVGAACIVMRRGLAHRIVKQQAMLMGIQPDEASERRVKIVVVLCSTVLIAGEVLKLVTVGWGFR